MKSEIDYAVYFKENIYFWLKVLFSVLLYPTIVLILIGLFDSEDVGKVAYSLTFCTYLFIIFVFIFIKHGILIGYIKGNAVKVSHTQFPDIFEIVEHQSKSLGLKTAPKVFILQSGGVLNAFATSFMFKKYVVLYSDIVDAAYDNDTNVLEFIIGHELGHIKRNHILKRMLLFPSAIIPFLEFAYYRACEYTCDDIGNSLNPKGTVNGLLILAAGRNLYKHVNTKEFVYQDKSEYSFWKWFAEKVTSHPTLSKRIGMFKDSLSQPKPVYEQKVYETPVEEHSKYMPKF
ncbi:MAG: M48 family metallopeptidase [Bacteroidota bacterium]